MNPEVPSSSLMEMAVLETPRSGSLPLWERIRAGARTQGAALLSFLAPAAVPLIDVARAASSIFLCGSWWAGALLCASLLLSPRYFAFAVVATLLGGGLARLLQFPVAMRRDGTLLYNVFLSALAVAWITRNTTLPPVAIYTILAVATVYTLLLSAALWHWFPLKAGLPPLSVAFVVTFGTLLTFFPLAAAASAALPLALPSEPALPFVVAAFLRSMGTVLFLPNVWAGLVVTAAILLWSRVAMINAVVGYAGGVVIVKLLEACGLQWFGWFAGHNYLLAGMALGSIYFIPSWSSLALAFAAGAVAALNAAAVQHFLRGSGWEYLPLPYLFTIWGMLCAMRLRDQSGSLLPATEVHETPEAAAAAQSIAQRRFPHRNETHVLLPTTREVKVTQGFDDRLSHRGAWRHALDFEVHDVDERPCPQGSDDDLASYYTQGLEVRAPGDGEVLRVTDGVADNEPGGCNFAQNWGNHVLLRLDYGGIVKIAHFTRNGVLVKAGQRIQAGELIGYCGNSGRSPVPHVHLHVQAGEINGAPTTPFCLTNFFTRTETGPRWHFAGVPKVGDRIAPATTASTVLGTLARFSPGMVTYRVTDSARPDSTSLERVRMALDDAGCYVWSSRNGSLTALLGLHALQVTRARPGGSLFLRLLSLAMPSVPFAYQSGMNWEDHAVLAEVRPQAGFFARCGRALAGTFSPYLPAAAVQVLVHHAAAPTGRRLHLVSTVQTPRRDLPVKVELEIETTGEFTSLTSLTAQYGDRTLRFEQSIFEPGLGHSN